MDCVPIIPITVKTFIIEIGLEEGFIASALVGARSQVPELERALKDRFRGKIPRIVVYPRDGASFTMPQRALLMTLFPSGSVSFQRPTGT